jgi:hypothetical protein
MLSWGWVRNKSKDGFVEMIWPPSNTKVTVALPGHQEATRDPIIKTVVQITTKGNRERFWNENSVGHSVDNLLAESPAPQIVEPAPTRKMRHRGISREVLGALVANGGSMTAKDIAKELHYDNEDAVAGACYYLTEIGKVERVMRGMYRALPRYQLGATMHHDVQGGVTASHAEASTKAATWERAATALVEHADKVSVAKPLLTPTPENKPGRFVSEIIEEIPSKPPTKEDDDETMNLLLDLMFPKGFKGSHLPAIEAWKKSTLKLMTEVRK